MKTRFIPLLALVSLLFFGCKPGTGGGGTTLWDGSFSSSTAAGTIAGKTFTLVSGWAETYYSDATKYEVSIYNLASSKPNPWDIGAYPITFGPADLYITYIFPKATGTYSLYWDMGTGANQIVNLIDPNGAPGGGPMNHICIDGAIRIDSIGAGTITGSVAAYNSGGDYVNGTFSLPIKP